MNNKLIFSVALLSPRYWFTWFGLSLLFLLVQLPYPWLCSIGSWMGKTSKIFLKRRVAITHRNLELCFPHLSNNEIEQLVDENFSSLGMGLIETGMAWFWPDERIKKWFDVSGLEHLLNINSQNRGVMLIGTHFMTLELGGRMMGLCKPMMATYRPHNNKAMEYVQTWGRSRSNKGMIDRRNLRGMVKALKMGENVWFAPDQDYGPKGSVFAPFFAVNQAATTNGTFIISRLAKPALMTVVLIRRENKKGYQLILQPELQDYPASDEIAAAEYINRVIEKEIMRAPSQYLWLHRRFKTRPVGETSLYTL